MKRYSLAAVLIACMLAFGLAGCGAAQKANKEDIEGFWVMDESAQLGFDAVINISEDEEDGALAELMVGDSFFEGEWTTDGTTATITFDDESGSTASVFVVDGKLTLGKADGSRIVFSKGDMDEYFADQDAAIEGIEEGDEGDEGDEEVIELDAGDASLETVEEKIDDIKAVSIVDDDTCSIQVTGKGTDFTGDPGYRLSVKNKTKKTIYITTDDDFLVGDKTVEAGVGEVIEAGETLETFIYFPQDDLGGDASALKDVSGKIIVGDDESGDEIETVDFKMS